MTDLIARVHAALGSDWKASRSPWEGLIRLYEADSDAFYLLASDGLSGEEDSLLQALAALARQVRLVIRVSPRDLASLKTLPPYVSHNLLKCARNAVLAPTAIYRGLNRDDKAPKRLREGWAICGKPRRACDNTGRVLPAPANMVYMV